LVLFGLLLVGTILSSWRRQRAQEAARRQRYYGRRLEDFRQPRVMASRDPMYGDRVLSVQRLAPDKIGPTEAFGRWMVSDETDYRRFMGFDAAPEVPEPGKHDREIRERINELKARRGR
jgi:hypothetical protein